MKIVFFETEQKEVEYIKKWNQESGITNLEVVFSDQKLNKENLEILHSTQNDNADVISVFVGSKIEPSFPIKLHYFMVSNRLHIQLGWHARRKSVLAHNLDPVHDP